MALDSAGWRVQARWPLIGIGLAAANGFLTTLTAGVFVARAGTALYPLYFVVLALLSVPVTIFFSRLIDRPGRLRFLAQTALTGAGLLAVLAFLGFLDAGPPRFMALAAYAVATTAELMTFAIFAVAIGEYRNSHEVTRLSGQIATAMAGGGIIGCGLAGIMGAFADHSLLLLAGAVLLAACGPLALRVVRHERRRDDPEQVAPESLGRSLSLVPKIMGRHRLVAWLGVTVLLSVVLQSVLEAQVFGVYQRTFGAAEKLLPFLGAMNALLHVLSVMVSGFITSRLVRGLGLGQALSAYPTMMFMAFLSFFVNPALGAAVFGHAVFSAVGQSLEKPVLSATFAALPARFVGRVRVMTDAVLNPAGMIIAALILTWAHRDLLQDDTLVISLVASATLLVIAVITGRAYTHGLIDLLMAGAVNLDDVGTDLKSIPVAYLMEVRGLLASDDPQAQLLGLELMSRADPKQFATDVANLVPRAPGPVRGQFAALFATNPDPTVADPVIRLMDSPEGAVRLAAVEVIVASGKEIGAERLERLLDDPEPEIADLATLAALRDGRLDIDEAIERLYQSPPFTREPAVRAARASRDARLLPLLGAFALDSDENLRAVVQMAIGDVGQLGDPVALSLVRRALEDNSPRVRAAALGAMALVAEPAEPDLVARGLSDPDRKVRLAATKALASLADGDAAIQAAIPFLQSRDDAIETAAINAIGRIGVMDPAGTADRLHVYLTDRYFGRVPRNLLWLDQLDAADPALRPLAVALEDENRRIVRAVLTSLAALGYQRVETEMRRLLTGLLDPVARARAVSVIMGAGERRFVQPVLPLLDRLAQGPRPRTAPLVPSQVEALVRAAEGDENPWIQRGAWRALAVVDPTRYSSEDTEMSRLLFLKGVPLFAGLGLDDLVTIDQILQTEDYLDGEQIVEAGEQGDKLYIVFDGHAAVVVGAKEVAQIEKAQYFGEMALFDDQPRSATVVAKGPVRLLAIARDRFLALIQQRPEVLVHVCKVFGDRLREANKRLAAAS